MFRLTRYFSLLSLGLMLIVSVLLGVYLRQHEIEELRSLSEDRSVIVATLFRNALWPRFVEALGDGRGMAGTELHAIAVRRGLHRALAELMRNTGVIKIKIYNLDGITIYSSDAEQIGEDKHDNPGFAGAAAGKVRSQMTHRDQIDAFEGRREDIDVFSSYIPVRDNTQVVAVFEIYQDVTANVRELDRTLWIAASVVAGTLFLLFSVQLLLIRRAQSLLERQAIDLKQLKQSMPQPGPDAAESAAPPEAPAEPPQRQP
jgi:hypothetical protein